MRVWKNITGYKFNVSCPAFPQPRAPTCTETGKNRNDARSKCIAKNSFCLADGA